jgi:hypothetical protein
LKGKLYCSIFNKYDYNFFYFVGEKGDQGPVGAIGQQGLKSKAFSIKF